MKRWPSSTDYRGRRRSHRGLACTCEQLVLFEGGMSLPVSRTAKRHTSHPGALWQVDVLHLGGGAVAAYCPFLKLNVLSACSWPKV
jgi:hypothetical protein